MKRIAKLLLLAALAAGTTAARAGMGILWSTGGGWVVAAGGDPDSGPGVAASDDVTWQLVYAGPDGVANAVDLSAANWTGGDDVLLAVRSIPAGGGTAADGTSWDDLLIQQGGDATYVDLDWSADRGGYVFQRIFQGTPSEGAPYAESGLFAFDPAFAGGPGALTDNFSFPEDGNGLVLDRTIPTSVRKYPLWVGGTQVTSANATNILGDGTARFESSASGGTLFLSNARITEAIEHPGINTANIWSDRGFDLTISLAGSNRVESAESTSDNFCVYARSNLAITGEGTLVAEMTGENGWGIVAYDNLRIDGATVTVSAGDTGLSFGNTLAISNATVTATGTSSHGIYCSGTNGRIDIADSVVTATGGATGLYPPGVGSSLAVSGASVVTAVTTSDDDVAFSAAALVLGDGLAVTEPAGGVFGEDGWGSGCVIDPATGAPAKRVVIVVPPPEPPSVSNVVARQRWPWNGLVDVDYEVGGWTTGLVARISFAERGGAGRTWVASNFIAGAEPTLNQGRNRATWDTKAAGVTNVVAAEVTAKVELVREE